MLFRHLVAATGLALIATAPAAAGELRQNPRAVLELFTSQGCSSCPKADAMLMTMSQDQGIIALAYHIDYWDYIGWSDTFGAEANSDRQREYASAWGQSRIFTPQLVVNGREGVVGSREGEVKDAVGKAGLDLPVELTPSGDMLEINVPANVALGEAVIWLVSYLDRAEVEIQSGENKGKTLSYTQIVTGRQALGMWEPATGAHLKLPLAEVLVGPANGAVIMVQQERAGLPGHILGAASYLR
jgi:hypothetical protein